MTMKSSAMNSDLKHLWTVRTLDLIMVLSVNAQLPLSNGAANGYFFISNGFFLNN